MTDSCQSLVGNAAFFTCQSGDVCVSILIDSVWKQCSGMWLLIMHVFEGWPCVRESVFLCMCVSVSVSVCALVLSLNIQKFLHVQMYVACIHAQAHAHDQTRT